MEDAKKKYTIEKDFSYSGDRITKMRDIDIHEYIVEAMCERIAKK